MMMQMPWVLGLLIGVLIIVVAVVYVTVRILGGREANADHPTANSAARRRRQLH